jgi:hypothetical protein
MQLQIPGHAHEQLHRTSFLLWTAAGPFYNLPFKFIQGLLNIEGYAFFSSLGLVKCGYCAIRKPGVFHAADALSCLAHCSMHTIARNMLFTCWPSEQRPVVRQWFDSATLQERRLFARLTVPLTLVQELILHPPLSVLPSEREREGKLKEMVRIRNKSLMAVLPHLMHELRTHPPGYLAPKRPVPGPDEWTRNVRRWTQPTLLFGPSPTSLPSLPPAPPHRRKRKRRRAEEDTGGPRASFQAGIGTYFRPIT